MVSASFKAQEALSTSAPSWSPAQLTCEKIYDILLEDERHVERKWATWVEAIRDQSVFSRPATEQRGISEPGFGGKRTLVCIFFKERIPQTDIVPQAQHMLEAQYMLEGTLKNFI